MKTNACPITLVGASQSGKTTLAAGLAKTSDEAFTVGFADDATRDYLQPRIANISDGRWPEATLGENFDISLNLNVKGGSTSPVVFKEYMGEKIRDQTYMEDIVGKPRGTLILMSPGMDILRDAVQREEMIANLKGIIDYLKKNHCVAVAFVVTACDRLKTDLADFAPKFEEYAAEVTNYLNTSGMVWKRFDVTITGELKSQNEPTIAAGALNTSREPFIWIMHRVAGRKRMLMAKHASRLAAGIVAAALVAAAAGYGILYNQDSAKLKAVENNAAAALAKIASAEKQRSESDLKAGTDDLHTAIAEAEGLSVRFSNLDGCRTNRTNEWRNVYDAKRAAYFLVSMDERYEYSTSRGSEDDCQKFDGMLDEFKPTEAKIKEQLVERWNGLRPKIRESYDLHIGEGFKAELMKIKGREKNQTLLDDLLKFRNKVNNWRSDFELSRQLKERIVDETNQLERDIYVEFDTREGNVIEADMDKIASDAAEKASAEALEDLRRQIAEWTPRTDVGSDRKKGLEDKYQAKSPKWRIAHSDWNCTEASEDVVRKIRGLEPDDQGLEAGNVCGVLRDAFGFGEKYATATPEVLEAATNRISEASGSFIDGLKTSFVKAWDINARKAPTIGDDDRKFIEDALDLANPENPDVKLSVVFLEKLEAARAEAEGKWRDAKRAICDEFIADTFTSGRSAASIFDAYRSWYQKNADNPSVEMVDKKVEDKLSEYFSSYVSNWHKEFRGKDWAWRNLDNTPAKVKAARQQFEDFKVLCLALAKDSCGISKRSRSVAFARLCRDKGNVAKGFDKAFEQTLTITGIDIQVDFNKTSGSFIGLSVGCSAEVVSCDPMGNINDEDSHVFRKNDRGYTIEERSSGKRQQLFRGKREFSTNPWKDVNLDLPMEDRVGFGHENHKLSRSWSLWGFETGEETRSARIESKHNDGNLDAGVTLYVQAFLTGPTLYGLWEEAAKEAAR